MRASGESEKEEKEMEGKEEKRDWERGEGNVCEASHVGAVAVILCGEKRPSPRMILKHTEQRHKHSQSHTGR